MGGSPPRLGTRAELDEKGQDKRLSASRPWTEFGFMPRVVAAEYRGHYRIHLRFNDNSTRVVDFRKWLEGPVFEPLKDRTYFQRFFIEGGTVAWPNGADMLAWPSLAADFFDEVLEYRVWCCPGRGASDEAEGDDYYYAFATYEEALQCFRQSPGAEAPCVLVRQREWVDEPEPDVYVHKKGERITEWDPAWLSRGARQPNAIEPFIALRTH